MVCDIFNYCDNIPEEYLELSQTSTMGRFFAKIVRVVNCFRRNAPSQIFERVLNILLYLYILIERRCAKPLITNGVISSEFYNIYSYPVDAEILIYCSRGYYLWLQGSSSTLTCTESEKWNKKIPECISLNVYRNRCLLDGSKFRLFSDNEGYNNVPGCIKGNLIWLSILAFCAIYFGCFRKR